MGGGGDAAVSEQGVGYGSRRTAKDMENIGDIASDKVWVAAGTGRYRNRESDMEVAGQQRIWKI